MKKNLRLILFCMAWVSSMPSQLWAQTEEKVIKLQNERATDLDIERSRLDREYDYLTNSQEVADELFDNERVLGLFDNPDAVQSPLGDVSRLNYLSFMGGSGYSFLGEIYYNHTFEQDWLKIHFKGISYQELPSLIDDLSIENGEKYRFDVLLAYHFVQKSEDNGTSYLHTLEGAHTDYSIGLQGFRFSELSNRDDSLFYYHFRLAYEGYYLFPVLVLEHSLSLGGGRYAPQSLGDDTGFIELGYDLTLSGADPSRFGGLFGDFTFDMDWLKKPPSSQDDSGGYRFLLGIGIGYIWEINRNWILRFHLGHVSEIIKTSDQVEADPFLPVVVLPKLEIDYIYNQSMSFILEAALKTETENLWEIYNQEMFYDSGVFPYLHRLAEGKFSFLYKDRDILEGVELSAYALYDFYFIYDRAYYTPGQFNHLSEEKNLQRLGWGVTLKLNFLTWLALEHESDFNLNLTSPSLIFPLVDTHNRLVFSIAQIYSRFILGYKMEWKDILSEEGRVRWSLDKHKLDFGYEFEYNRFVVMLYLDNVLNNRNHQEIPDIRENGFAILGGIKYNF